MSRERGLAGIWGCTPERRCFPPPRRAASEARCPAWDLQGHSLAVSPPPWQGWPPDSGWVPAHLQSKARWGHRCGRPAGGNACGKVVEEQGLQRRDLCSSPWPRGWLAAPALHPGMSPTSWCWARSGCRRCHPRHNMGPGPGSTRHRLCRRHRSGAGAAGPVLWWSQRRADAGGRAEVSIPMLWHGARQSHGGHGNAQGSSLTHLGESCRLVMGEASCEQSMGRS